MEKFKSLIGRSSELEFLHKIYEKKESQIFVLYGRRRIGKSTLIQHFSKKRPHLFFEGIENQNTLEQIHQFKRQLTLQVEDPLLKLVEFKNWNEIFDYLTQYLKKSKKKTILFFDELQWMAAKQSKLISLIKYYWDNHWKHSNCLLILCGSVASFMVKSVIGSKALYGRIDHEMKLEALSLQDCFLLLDKKRSQLEVLKYQLVFGGVPKYFELIDRSASFDSNIQRLCFEKDSYFLTEFERIFFSQFREAGTYKSICKLLNDKKMTALELSRKLNIPSGGGLTGYLKNLEIAGFVEEEISLSKSEGSKEKRYSLRDPYLLFYFKFIAPNLGSLKTGKVSAFFKNQILPKWNPWLGLSFERFCVRNSHLIAKAFGFLDSVYKSGPYYRIKKEGVQIDLAFLRNDKVATLGEIKFLERPIDQLILPELDSKFSKFPIPKGYTLERALITINGLSGSMKKLNYFHHVLEIGDFFVHSNN